MLSGKAWPPIMITCIAEKPPNNTKIDAYLRAMVSLNLFDIIRTRGRIKPIKTWPAQKIKV